jgi:uncharacterized protein
MDPLLGQALEVQQPAPTPPGVDRARNIDGLRGLVAVLGVALVWNIVGNLAVPDEWYVPANLLGAAIVVAIGRGNGLTSAELGLSRRDLARGMLFGLGAAALVGAALAVALAVPTIRVLLEDGTVAADPTWMRWFRPLVRIPLGTVLFEELLFRAVLYGFLLRRHGHSVATAVTAALFGLWHIVPAWESAVDAGLGVTGVVVTTVAVTTAGGVLFAALRQWCGSVVAPMVAHTATNSLAYVAAIFALDLMS